MTFPKFKPGKNVISASEMNRLSDAAARAEGNFGSQGRAGLIDFPGSRTIVSEPERDIWIRLTSTGTLVDDVAAYSWEMVLRAGDGQTIVPQTTERSGSWNGLAAFEMNGNVDVPSGTIVRARWGESDARAGLEFAAVVPTAALSICELLQQFTGYNGAVVQVLSHDATGACEWLDVEECP